MVESCAGWNGDTYTEVQPGLAPRQPHTLESDMTESPIQSALAVAALVIILALLALI